MSTQVDKYTTQKKAKIFFTALGDTITFSPFLESFSLQSDITVQEAGSSFGKVFKTQKVNKHIFNISFNVPSESWEEAKENHRKFGLLIRMNLSDIGNHSGGAAVNTGLGVRFANLIHDLKPETANVLTSSVFVLINKISYVPDLDLGFFDKGGILYAKNFKLSLELIKPNGLGLVKLVKDDIDKSQTPAGKSLRINSPGRLFGFNTPYGDDS